MIYGDDMTKAYLYNRGPHAVTFRGSIIVETMTWYGTDNKVQQWHGDFASEVRLPTDDRGLVAQAVAS